MSDEADAVAKIRGTFDQLDADRDLWATAHPPTPGSPLADDDAVWPSSPLSSHTRQCLACAWDHLDLVRLTIEQQHAYPTATFSVLRGALLGAAQGRWLLLPDDPDLRRERGLAMAHEWYLRRIQWQGELSPDIDVDNAARSGAQLRRLDDDLAQVKALRTTKATLNATEIVREAAGAAFGAPSFTREAVREWRRLGGDAHALGWPLMGQSVSWGPRGTDGLSQANVIGNLVSVANAYLLAWTLYRQAIDRYDKLNTAP